MKIRTSKACIICKMVQKYREQSNSVNPNNYNRKISKQSTYDLITSGAEQMGKEAFRLATEKVVKEL